MNLEHIQCIFCKKSSNQVVIEENGYTGRKCPICNLIYVSPRPALSETLNLYVEEKAQSYAMRIIPHGFAKRMSAKHTLCIIKKFKKNGSLLELGAGAGYFLDEARKKGFEVSGNELNKIQADFMRKNLRIDCEETALTENSFGGKLFDVIYHCNVLSHFHDPISEFAKINSKLKNGGIHLFETGNTGDVEKKFYKYFKKFDYPDHLFFFGERSVQRLLEVTGFELVRMYRYSRMGCLLMSKYLKKLKRGSNSLGGKAIRSENQSNRSTCQCEGTSGRRGFAQNAKEYLLHVLTYKVGYLIPKKGMPQTLIVIARKRTG